MALSLMVEVLGGATNRIGCANSSRTMLSNGVFLNVYNIGNFVDLDFYYDELESVIAHLMSSRVASGFQEILLPGKPYFSNAKRVSKQTRVERRDRAGRQDVGRESVWRHGKWESIPLRGSINYTHASQMLFWGTDRCRTHIWQAHRQPAHPC